MECYTAAQWNIRIISEGVQLFQTFRILRPNLAEGEEKAGTLYTSSRLEHIAKIQNQGNRKTRFSISQKKRVNRVCMIQKELP